MKRSEMLNRLEENDQPWDVIIIGGGATGLGTAVDAASRGFRTLLLEKSDFAKGTSSRSTKLVHGGVRYLQQGNVSLVKEALKERGYLIRNAPHLVRNQSFMIPVYNWWRGWFYWVGLKLYDLLSGKLSLGRSEFVSLKEIKNQVPSLLSSNLRGGVLYHDGQFDDARFAVNLAQTCADKGGVPINYMNVTGLLKKNGKVNGVEAEDQLDGRKYKIRGKSVINATGVFTDHIIQMDDPSASSMIQPSQGIHLVVDKEIFASESAIMIPRTSDGRVLFAVPWQDKMIIGTTDTPVDEIREEPEAMEEEVEYILDHINQYLQSQIERSDVNSVFAGLRPLVKSSHEYNTSSLSRDFSIIVSSSELITITGGKWTTYRKMAESVIDKAIAVKDLPHQDCNTQHLRIHGWQKNGEGGRHLEKYGSDQAKLEKIRDQSPALNEKLHERLPYIKAEVIWSVRHEMAMTVEDFLARRTRALFLNAAVSKQIAPEVARLMAKEMDKDEAWVESQIEQFKHLAASYQVNGDT